MATNMKHDTHSWTYGNIIMAIKMQHDTTLDLEIKGYVDRGDEASGVKPGFVITEVMLGGCDLLPHLSNWDVAKIQEYCDFEVDDE